MLLRELFQFDCADLDIGISCSIQRFFHFEAVIPAKAGIQRERLDSGSSPE